MRTSIICITLLWGSSSYSFASDDITGAKAIFYGEQNQAKLVKTSTQGNASSLQKNDLPNPTAAKANPASIVSVSGTKKPKTRAPSNLGLMAWLDMIDDNNHVQRVSSKREFRSGDAIRLNVQTNRAGYLYVVNLGSSGEARQLFPAQGKSIKVVAGKTYSVPGKGHIRFDNTPGTEEVLVLISPRPIAEMPQLKQTSYSTTKNDGWTKVALATGAKDLLVEEETEGLHPAVFAVDRQPVLQSGSAVSLRMSLNHR